MDGRTLSFCAIMVAAMLFSTGAMAQTADFRAQGNEPSWSIQKNGEGITFNRLDGEAVKISPLPGVRKSEVYQATVAGQPFTLKISDEVCTDAMSGMPFPSSVSVTLGKEEFKGCGGEPKALLEGEWIVTEINGKPVIAESQASISFTADGQVNGNASCNRYFGPFKLTGEGLTISDLGSTMMMCEPTVVDQERLFLGVMGEVNRFEIKPNGALVLHGKDSNAISAKRKSQE